MTGPVLVVPMNKTWSDESRASAAAARKAKAMGRDPGKAKHAAKKAIQEGKTVPEAVQIGLEASHRTDAEKKRAADIDKLVGEVDKFVEESKDARGASTPASRQWEIDRQRRARERYKRRMREAARK